MSYSIPAQAIRISMTWGFGGNYQKEAFFKTIRKKDLIEFFKYYKVSDIELVGTKKQMFETIKSHFDQREDMYWRNNG